MVCIAPSDKGRRACWRNRNAVIQSQRGNTPHPDYQLIGLELSLPGIVDRFVVEHHDAIAIGLRSEQLLRDMKDILTELYLLRLRSGIGRQFAQQQPGDKQQARAENLAIGCHVSYRYSYRAIPRSGLRISAPFALV